MFLNVIQLAESLGVEERVIESWIREEKLPCVRDSGRLLFDRAQVAAWAAERGLAAKTGFLAPSAGGQAAIQLEPLLRVGGIWQDIGPETVLARLERIVGALPGVSADIRQLLASRVRIPSGLTWAPVGYGLALPHLRSRVALGRGSGLLAMLSLTGPLGMSDRGPDNQPITRLIFFVAPSPRMHLELLARLSFALRNLELRKLVLENAAPELIFAAFKRFDEQGAFVSTPGVRE